MKERQSQPLDAFLLCPRIQPGSGPCAQQACSWGARRCFGAQSPQEFSHKGLDKSCASLWTSEAETGAVGFQRRWFRGGARVTVGRAPAGWRQAQLHHLHRLHRLRLPHRLLLPAGIGPSHTSFFLAPSLCVPASPCLRVSASPRLHVQLPQDDAQGKQRRRREQHAYSALRPLPGALAAEAQPARGERAPWVPRAWGAEPELGHASHFGTSSVCGPVSRGLPSWVLSPG